MILHFLLLGAICLVSEGIAAIFTAPIIGRAAYPGAALLLYAGIVTLAARGYRHLHELIGTLIRGALIYLTFGEGYGFQAVDESAATQSDVFKSPFYLR